MMLAEKMRAVFSGLTDQQIIRILTLAMHDFKDDMNNLKVCVSQANFPSAIRSRMEELDKAIELFTYMDKLRDKVEQEMKVCKRDA